MKNQWTFRDQYGKIAQIKRGDVYQIKFLDSELKHAIEQSKCIPNDKIILGKTYTAILEHVGSNDIDGNIVFPLFYDFMILAESPLIQIRIRVWDIDEEKVWCRRIPVPASYTTPRIIPTDLGSLHELIRSVHIARYPNEEFAKYEEELELIRTKMVQEMFEPLIGRYFRSRDPKRKRQFQIIDNVPDIHVWQIPAICVQLEDGCVTDIYELFNDRSCSWVASDAYMYGIEKFFEENEEITEEEFMRTLCEYFKLVAKNNIPSRYRKDDEDDNDPEDNEVNDDD
jgi:hypothetical protein